MCSVCQVRLRPKVFSTVLRNEAIVQCDSCRRILYYAPPVVPTRHRPHRDPIFAACSKLTPRGRSGRRLRRRRLARQPRTRRLRRAHRAARRHPRRGIRRCDWRRHQQHRRVSGPDWRSRMGARPRAAAASRALRFAAPGSADARKVQGQERRIAAASCPGPTGRPRRSAGYRTSTSDARRTHTRIVSPTRLWTGRRAPDRAGQPAGHLTLPAVRAEQLGMTRRDDCAAKMSSFNTPG